MTTAILAAWTLSIELQGVSQTFEIDPPPRIAVSGEAYDSLPVWNPNGWAFTKGMRLRGVFAVECSVAYALETDSVRVETREGRTLVAGTDYVLDPVWASIGRLEGGALAADTPVRISYAYRQQRLDSIVRAPDGSLSLVKGVPDTVLPVPPDVDGERVANIFVSGTTTSLSDENVFPVGAPYPAPATQGEPVAARLCPKTYAKLVAGERVVVLAWGDSVTETAYVTDPEHRWQNQFVARLRKRFPKADIELVSAGWGGRTSKSFMDEPAGSPHNYAEKVLDVRPDLVVSEFINDSGLFQDQASLDERYGRILRDFRERGMEWIILTPHYSRCDWMGLASQKNCDDDPRPYVKALRVFAKENGVALADASLRWGHLWREGIPHETLLVNNINHPNPYGLKLFADALEELF